MNSNNNHVLSGVHCSVSNCTYHCSDNSCAASSIQVGANEHDCKSSEETLCSTFKRNHAE